MLRLWLKIINLDVIPSKLYLVVCGGKDNLTALRSYKVSEVKSLLSKKKFLGIYL